MRDPPLVATPIGEQLRAGEEEEPPALEPHPTLSFAVHLLEQLEHFTAAAV
jgi:hypothetical protein